MFRSILFRLRGLAAVRVWRIVFVVSFLLVFQGILMLVYAQETPSVVTVGFPLILLIPLVFGMFLHWFKGYTRNTITVSWWLWLLQNLPLTISALIGAIGMFAGLYALNPAAYDPSNIASWLSVILIGYSFDSAVNGTVLVKQG